MTDERVGKLERELKRAQASRERQEAKSRLLIEITRHIGSNKAIGAGELYEIVFEEPYEGNKITGTRRLRKLIEEVKYGDNPTLIAHSCCNIRPGYYMPVGSEEREYRERENRKVKRKIGRLAKLFRVNDAVYAGQLALSMRENQE
jgi:hypothetical protein